MAERGPQHMDEWGEPVVNEWEEQRNEWRSVWESVKFRLREGAKR